MSYTVKTFGCKVNTYDTSLLQRKLNYFHFNEKDQGFVQYHIVNTCAVTAAAVTESLRWIRGYKRKNPNTVIVVTGCGSQVELNRYSESSDIDLIIANSHKNQLPEILEKHKKNQLHQQRIFHSNIFKNNDKGQGGQVESRHTRLFLKIQDGCNQFCTFCVIPFARGRSRSLSSNYLCDQITEIHSTGVMEVVLTGVHIGDYKDPETEGGLDYLVGQILKKTKIPRIRLSSLEPIELDDSLFSLYKDSRMCPHFHLSVQSGNSKILKDMKRKYNQDDIKNCLEKIHKHFCHAFVGMDIIAGFPGENQKDFEDTYELFKNLYWTQMHVFPYSPRPSTYALRRKDHCSRSLIVRRAALLRNLSYQRFREQALFQIGKIKSVLPLKKGGICRDYWSVEWKKDSYLEKKFSSERKVNEQLNFEVKVRLVDWNENTGKFKACAVNEK